MSEVKTLGNQMKILSGFPFPSSDFTSERNGKPIIRIRDLQQQSPETYFTGDYDGKFLISKGDVLVGMDGDFNAVKWQGPQSLLNQRVCKITTKDPTILDQDFLYHSLQPQLNSIHCGTAQTTVKHLSTKDLYSIDAEIPPLPEQKKIAEILSGIDMAKDLLAKSVEAKANLRSALLTELIDDRESNTKIDSVAKRVSGHTPSKSNPNYWNGGIPWISLTDTGKLDDRYILETAKEISSEGIANSSAVLHPPGVVVISRDARVGCSAITSREMAMSQHFVGWICSDKLFNKYLYYLLQKWKPKFEAIAMGSTIPTIGVPFFRDLEIPVPDIRRQVQIAEMMESVDIEIAALRAKIRAVQNQKLGIAADLLSGRKRVSV